jgi:DNA (cytosine-5)-methyltransferase 1
MKILDLFCGAGGAAMGLHQAFPEAEIVGVDIKPQPRYPFKFVRDDAMNHLDCNRLCSFDLIWASPPCQRYSCVTPRNKRSSHPDLIVPVRDCLLKTEGPFVIENVVGAPLNNPLMLCGSMFGLRTRRHRIFETNFAWLVPGQCNHSEPVLLVTTAGANSRKIGNHKSVKHASEAYGIDWMDGEGLKEAIPPAYSRYIGEQFEKTFDVSLVGNGCTRGARSAASL